MALVGAPSITPRWEWRCFGAGFGEAEAALGALTPEQVVESDEVYLVSAEGHDVVKVRDELMDIKRLLQVDDDGLEQWTPHMKAHFPLSPADAPVRWSRRWACPNHRRGRTRSPRCWPTWSLRARSCGRSRCASAVSATSSAAAWRS